MKVRLVLGSNSQRQTFRIEWSNYFQFIEKFMSNTEHTLENVENTRTHNFITQIIRVNTKAFILVFHLSRTAIYISATQNRFA